MSDRQTLSCCWLLAFSLMIGCTDSTEKTAFNAAVSQSTTAPQVDSPDTDESDSKPDDPVRIREDLQSQQAQSNSDSDQGAEADVPDSDNMKHIPFPEEEEEDYEDEYVEKHTIDIPASWKRLGEVQEVWIDVKAKQVICGGVVCLNRGPLEMFVCPFDCHKEHESIITSNVYPFQVHSALLALGVKPGQSVRWNPEYTPATGPKIKFTVMWKEGDKIKKRDGKEMVRNFNTQKPLEEDWVFGGSFFLKTGEGDEEYYLGNDGEFVCVSNFSAATFDIPVESSDAAGNLVFEANTERIPPIGTKVYVLIEEIPEDE